MSGDPALPRFMVLQVVRLIGAGMALAGVVIRSHGQPALAHIPDPVGDALIVLGAGVFFAVPIMLAKRWKSPK